MPRRKRSVRLVISPKDAKENPHRFLDSTTKQNLYRAEAMVSNLSPDVQEIFRKVRFFNPEDPQYWNDLIKSA